MAQEKRARHRLTEMEVQEVSLVDRPANVRKFLVRKRDDTMPNEIKKEAIKLPPDAKAALMDGMGMVLDRATSLATIIGEAQEDPEATVPEDMSVALLTIGEVATELGNQFANAPPADTDEGEKPEGEAPPGAEGDEAPPVPPPGAGPEQKAADDVAKGLPTPENTSPNLKSPEREGDNLSQALRKGIAAAQLELAGVEKAGRKMAAARYKKLADLHGELGKLLNELSFDDASEAADKKTAAAAKKNADGDKGPPAEKAPTAKTATEERLEKLEAKLAGALERIEKMRITGGGRSNAGGDGEPPPPKAPQKVQWPLDIGADLKRRKQQEKGAARR